jgi:hypothetical protein
MDKQKLLMEIKELEDRQEFLIDEDLMYSSEYDMNDSDLQFLYSKLYKIDNISA